MWGGPIRVVRRPTHRFNSDRSTADTIDTMRAHVHQYKSHPVVVEANRRALGLVPYAAQRDVACSIFHWVRGRVRFVEDEWLMYEQLGIEPDELDKELLLPPPTLLAMPVPMGDCDDFSLLIASMLAGAGIQPFFVTVAADPWDRLKFSHVYVCARLADEGAYLNLDAGNRLTGVQPGWENDRITRKAIWTV